MPIHDWTRVADGIVHDFHHEWISAIMRPLNRRGLPRDHYALAELRGAAPSEAEFTSLAESKTSRIAIRHVSGDTVVAMIEVVSPGNKSSQHALHSFVEKAREFLEQGIHLLVLDLIPPSVRDPNGIHGAIWSAFNRDDYRQPLGEPLTLVSYCASEVKQAFIEPTAVGRRLIDMPLYLTPEGYVPVPLEATYQAAFDAVPARWRTVLEETR